MSFASAIPMALQVGGTLLSMKGQADQADAAREAAAQAQATAARRKAAAEFQARQAEQQAIQTVASGQRDALEQERQGRLLASRAVAIAAASGGGASSPTVMNIVANLAKESAYRASIALYHGEDQARKMRDTAAGLRYEGDLAVESGAYNARAAMSRANAYETGMVGSLVKGGTSFFSKYGGGGADNSTLPDASTADNYY